MNNQNRKKLLTIHLIRNIIVTFFNVFLGIYILQIIGNDLTKYSLIMIYSLFIHFVCQYFILKYLTTKNFTKIYRMGTFLLVLSIGFLLFLKENIIYYIWLFYIIRGLAEMFYWIPYETAIVDVNKKGGMDKFVSFAAATTQIATIIVPIFSGFVITNFSYSVIFLIFLILALIIFIISFTLKDIIIGESKLEIKKLIWVVKENKSLKYIYISSFFKNLSQSGAIANLIPIVIFLKLGTEFKLGSLTTVFAIVTLVAISIYNLKIKNAKPKIYIILAIIFTLGTILLVIHPSFISFLIYNFIYCTAAKIVELGSNSSVYGIINDVGHSELKKEHLVIFYYIINTAQILSWFIVILLINFNSFQNENVLTIAIAALSILFIPASIYLYKSKKNKN